VRRIWIAALIILVPLIAGAQSPFLFDNVDQKMRFSRLMTELRCLVCQNQSLEDSNAPLAQDLRKQAYDMMAEGATDAQIMEHMVNRYGDFVRYRPAFKPVTLVLWLGPLLLLVSATWIAWRWHRSQRASDRGALSAEQVARVARLLHGKTPLLGTNRK
jgi:cytochrome c-type biogenesis protein CcmH